MGGTVKDAPNFDGFKDAEHLRKAMKGMGTDEKEIIEVICHRSNKQRQEIIQCYKQSYGRDLVDDFKSEVNGHFLALLESLCRTPPEEDAYIIHHAIHGAGTNEQALIEVICTRHNARLAKIKTAYEKMYGKDLEKAVMSDTSGDFRRLLVSLLTAHRAEGHVDEAAAKKDAEELYGAGEGRFGTEESKFNQVLASRSHEQLRLVFEDYKKVSNHKIEKAIKKELSGNLERAYIAIIKSSRNSHKFFAKLLYKAMHGAGTNDEQLIRVIVTRSEIDLEEIKHHFKELYHKSLHDVIESEISGNYKKAVLALVRD